MKRDKTNWEVELTPARLATRRAARPAEPTPSLRAREQVDLAGSISELLTLMRRIDARLTTVEAQLASMTATPKNGSSPNGAAVTGAAPRTPNPEISRARARIQDASAEGARRIAGSRERSRRPPAEPLP